VMVTGLAGVGRPGEPTTLLPLISER